MRREIEETERERVREEGEQQLVIACHQTMEVYVNAIIIHDFPVFKSCQFLPMPLFSTFKRLILSFIFACLKAGHGAST